MTCPASTILSLQRWSAAPRERRAGPLPISGCANIYRGMVRNPQRLAPPLALAGTVPWWGVASSVFAPIILIGGWTVAADLQPVPFNAIQRSISALGAVGMPYRWIIAVTLLGVGVCHAATGIALRPAAEAGRALLVIGGVSSILIAVNPQPSGGGSLAHEVFSLVGVVVMTLWPLAAVRRELGAPFGLRPTAAVAVTVFTLALLVWFSIELFHGPELGLAERTVTADQSIWPLLVVLSVRWARQRWLVPAEEEAAACR